MVPPLGDTVIPVNVLTLSKLLKSSSMIIEVEPVIPPEFIVTPVTIFNGDPVMVPKIFVNDNVIFSLTILLAVKI